MRDWVHETWLSGFGSTMEKWALGMLIVEQGLSSFLAIFSAYLMILQCRTLQRQCESLKHNQICQKYSKKNENPCWTCLLKTHFFADITDLSLNILPKAELSGSWSSIELNNLSGRVFRFGYPNHYYKLLLLAFLSPWTNEAGARGAEAAAASLYFLWLLSLTTMFVIISDDPAHLLQFDIV